MSKIQPLAQSFVKVVVSPDSTSVFTYSPGICKLPNETIIVTCDIGGPEAYRLAQAAGFETKSCGKAFLSSDGGDTFRHVLDFPFVHARPFVAGKSLYIIGQYGDLFCVRSDDWGEHWGPPVNLTAKGESWHQAPCNVWYKGDCVYLVMECKKHYDMDAWAVNDNAPVVLRGRIQDDLTNPDNWTFSNRMTFRDFVDTERLYQMGLPFYQTPPKNRVDIAPGRSCSPMGLLETNIVQILDPNHYWYDPAGHTFHLFSRAHTGGTGYACVLKAVEQEDGQIFIHPEQSPSGKDLLLLPFPGGQMKFHMLYDSKMRIYWLLSSQATDSMTRAELLEPERYNLPNNERHRLMLSFSRNCVDWCFAGMVAIGASPKQSRHYASMDFDGEDIIIASRSGDQEAASAHNGNFISFHRVNNFRELVY